MAAARPDPNASAGTGDFTAGHQAARQFAAAMRRMRLQLEFAAAGAQAFARLAPAIRALQRIEALLRRPLRLALMGEFNAGKSTIANLLIGDAPLPTLQLSNTRIPTLIHYSPEPVVTAAQPGGAMRVLTAGTVAMPADTLRIQLGMPIPHLLACEIVDFPGVCDPWLGYGPADIARLPVDAAIWCTFGTQAWKESEARAWRLLPAPIRSHGLLAVTGRDLLTADQAAKVMARLHRVAGGDFSDFALLAAAQARKALGPAGGLRDPALWQTSGAADFCARVEGLLSDIRQRRLHKAKALANDIAATALARLETARGEAMPQ